MNDSPVVNDTPLATASQSVSLHDVASVFQALLESAPDPMVIADERGQIVIVNAQAEHLFGYMRAEMIGQPVEFLLPSRLTGIHEQHRAGYMQEPRTRPMGVGMELLARRSDGTEVAVEVSLSPLHSEHGLLVTSVIRDVTARKRAEHALAHQAAMLREQANLLDLAHDMIIVRDLERRITFWNRGAEAMYGWSREDALGRVADALLQTEPPDSLATIDAALVEHGFWEGEQTHTRRDGSRLIVASRQVVQRGEQDRPTMILEINTDITEQKRAGSELERQVSLRTAHLRALLTFSTELLPVRHLDDVLLHALQHALTLAPEAHRAALYVAERDSTTLALRAQVGYASPPHSILPIDTTLVRTVAHRRGSYLVYASDDAAHPGMLDAVSPTFGLTSADSTALAVVPLLAQDALAGVLVLVRERNTGPFLSEALQTLEGIASIAAAAIQAEQSREEASFLSTQLARAEALHRTMTERLSVAEASVLQTARLAAVGQLAASIAHEINNPLYATRNALYLIHEELPPELRDTPYLIMAQEQLARIARITERMRDFYRPARGELAQQNLNELIEGTLALVGLDMRYDAIELKFSPAAELPTLLCNSDQLRQVFLNLILNAMEAMPQGGILNIRTAAGSSVALIEISDTGIGIPDEVREHLFEPFFTTKSTGTGLGLSISAHIVTQHGGQITVDSTPGHGTTFRITLPYHPPT